MRLRPPIVGTALVVFISVLNPIRSASGRTQESEGHHDVHQTLAGTIQIPSDMAKYPDSIQVTLDGPDYHQTTSVTPGGNFLFTNVPSGDVTLEVRAPGFDTTRTEIRDWTGSLDVSVPLGRAVDVTDRVPRGSSTVSVKTLKVPEKAMKLATRGQEESDKQHFDKAIDWLQKAVKACPEFVEAWNNMGVTYLRMGKQKEAEAAFLKALETDSKAVPTLRNLGILYLQTARPREALSVLQRAREARGEKDLYIDTYLGHALYGLGRYQEAEAVLREAIQLRSDFPAALYPLALAQVRLHKYDDARQTLTRFLQTSDQGTEVDVARSVLTRLEHMSGGEEPKSAE